MRADHQRPLERKRITAIILSPGGPAGGNRVQPIRDRDRAVAAHLGAHRARAPVTSARELTARNSVARTPRDHVRGDRVETYGTSLPGDGRSPPRSRLERRTCGVRSKRLEKLLCPSSMLMSSWRDNRANCRSS